jgi:hypothetical protein
VSDLSLDINAWILSHQALVVAVGIPLLTTLVAGIISWLTNRANLAAQTRSRELQRMIKLADFRQEWINSLRNEIAEHQALCLASMPALNQGTSISQDRTYRLAELSNKILLRVGSSDPEYKKLSKALAIDQLRISQNEIPAQDTNHISKSILEREWERLKQDLKLNASGW